jgi:hypothetical protein
MLIDCSFEFTNSPKIITFNKISTPQSPYSNNYTRKKRLFSEVTTADTDMMLFDDISIFQSRGKKFKVDPEHNYYKDITEIEEKLSRIV